MMQNMSNFNRQSSGKLVEWVLVAVVSAVLLLGGCQLVGKRRIIACPLSYQDQAREILKVVPRGTSRDEVVEKLTAAGIEGSFGQSHLHYKNVQKSVYYCDVWNRNNGKRWHVDVALLFDSSGKLYATRQGEAQTGFESNESETSEVASPEEAPATTEEGATGEPSFEAAPVSTSTIRRRGQSRRTPFRDPGDF